jgi:predicted tellurium resistance membrane protein TerC
MPIIDFLAPHFAFVNDPTAWVALLTLVVLEIVLGIDNLIFISILTNKLPAHQQSRARKLGIGAALLMRLALLATISIIVQLTTPVFTALGHGFSWRDMILIAGGMGYHVPKGYIYAAMGFSALVEGLNMLARSRKTKREPGD